MEGRLLRKSFGRACYVDSTPLPNSIDSPFNALCSHGLDATSVQMRLALVLDETSLYPVWYEIIPGNPLDLSTLTTVTKDVEISLDLHLSNYTLDAEYASKELIQNFESQQDNFVIEEEPEEVVMVDISEEIPDEGQESDQTDEGREEETFDDVFSDDDSDQGEFDLDVEDQDVEVVEMAEPEPVDDIEAVQANVTPESHDDVEEVFVEPEASLDDEA